MHAPRKWEADLTRREKVVLEQLVGDATLEDIAQRLFVTRNTVKTQVASVYRKLGVTCRADAVALVRSSRRRRRAAEG